MVFSSEHLLLAGHLSCFEHQNFNSVGVEWCGNVWKSISFVTSQTKVIQPYFDLLKKSPPKKSK